MAYDTDRTFTENFNDHPQSNGMNYPIHLIYALSLAAEAVVYAIMFAIHGLLPFILQSSGSRGIISMAKKFEDNPGGEIS